MKCVAGVAVYILLVAAVCVVMLLDDIQSVMRSPLSGGLFLLHIEQRNPTVFFIERAKMVVFMGNQYLHAAFYAVH